MAKYNKVKCICGRDITTMRGCRREFGYRFSCRKCKRDVSSAKLEQLSERIRIEYACE